MVARKAPTYWDTLVSLPQNVRSCRRRCWLTQFILSDVCGTIHTTMLTYRARLSVFSVDKEMSMVSQYRSNGRDVHTLRYRSEREDTSLYLTYHFIIYILFFVFKSSKKKSGVCLILKQ